MASKTSRLSTFPQIVFLCAGYGTRLQKDLLDNGNYPQLEGKSKALLPLNGKPLLSHWIDIWQKQLELSKEELFSYIFIICNDFFFEQFCEYANNIGFPLSHIKSDGSISNDTRLGAVKDLQLAIELFNIEGDILVVAGDTLFLNDFSLPNFIRIAQNCPGSVITYYVVSDLVVSKSGIIEVVQDAEGNFRVSNFLEKPDPTKTKSRLGCPCFYYLRSNALSLFQDFLDEKKGSDLADIDATGKFLAWFIHKMPVYATSISGRLDIGDLKSFLSAEDYLSSVNDKDSNTLSSS